MAVEFSINHLAKAQYEVADALKSIAKALKTAESENAEIKRLLIQLIAKNNSVIPIGLYSPICHSPLSPQDEVGDI